MRGDKESDEDFYKRINRAQKHADEKRGRPPQAVAMWLVSAFFAGSLPAYFALMISGYNSNRLEIPLMFAGAALSGLTYLLIRESQKLWHKEYMRYLEQTKPEE